MTEQIARSPGRDLPLRVYHPTGAGELPPVLVNFHGGSWCFGEARQSEWWCSEVAVDADRLAVSGDSAGGRDPFASPLYAPSHAGLPPALVQTARSDALGTASPTRRHSMLPES